MKFSTASDEPPAKVLDRLRVDYNDKGKELYVCCPWCGADGRKDGKASINAAHGAFRCLSGKCNRKASFYEFRVAQKDGTIPSERAFTVERKTYSAPRPLPVRNTEHSAFGDWLKSRGLTKETAERFGVCLTKYVDKAGKDHTAVAFPHTENGEEVYRQYRLQHGFDAKALPWKTFVSESDCRPVLFGRDLCTFDEPYLIITEGQCDAMAVYQMGLPNVVSVPNGASNMDWVQHSYDWLMGFDDILLALDTDGPGEKAADEIAQRLGVDRCRRLKIEPHKDMNDALRAGCGKTELWQAFKEAGEYRPPKLRSVMDYIDKVIEYRTSDVQEGDPTPWDGLTEILHGFRGKEQTLWSGDDGVGKSTGLIQLAANFATRMIPVLMGSFELPPERYLNWMSDMLCQGNWTPAKCRENLTRIAPYFYVIEHVGQMPVAELLTIYGYANKRFGVRQFITDSLMMVGEEEYNFDRQADFMHAMKTFVMANNVHHHLVAHAKKGESDKTAGKDKASVMGSKALTKLADNVIMVCQEENKEGENAACYFHLKKNREFGTQRKIHMIFNKKNRQFDEMTPEEKEQFVTQPKRRFGR
jgi:twinkle protein